VVWIQITVIRHFSQQCSSSIHSSSTVQSQVLPSGLMYRCRARVFRTRPHRDSCVGRRCWWSDRRRSWRPDPGVPACPAGSAGERSTHRSHWKNYDWVMWQRSEASSAPRMDQAKWTTTRYCGKDLRTRTWYRRHASNLCTVVKIWERVEMVWGTRTG